VLTTGGAGFLAPTIGTWGRVYSLLVSPLTVPDYCHGGFPLSMRPIRRKRKRKTALVFESSGEDRNREYSLSIYLIRRPAQPISKAIEIEKLEPRCHRTRRMRVSSEKAGGEITRYSFGRWRDKHKGSSGLRSLKKAWKNETERTKIHQVGWTISSRKHGEQKRRALCDTLGLGPGRRESRREGASRRERRGAGWLLLFQYVHGIVPWGEGEEGRRH